MSQDKDIKTIALYFKTYDEQVKINGKDTVLLMQVGDFYEMYSYYDPENDEYYGTNLFDLRDVLSMQKIGNKGTHPTNKSHKIKMWGVPTYKYDEYCNKLTQEKYTVIRMDQVKDSKGSVKQRIITENVTPGTYISRADDTYDTESNNIGCLYMKKYFDRSKQIDRIAYGYSNINSYTGETDIFQGITESIYIDSTVLNEIERHFVINNPNEILFVSNLEDKLINKVISCIGIAECLIRYFNMDNKEIKKILIERNIEDVISRQFGTNKQYFSELEWYNLGTTSLVFLIDYVKKRNPLVVEKLRLPSYSNESNRVILENHTLQQLNIVEDLNNVNSMKTSSLINLQNNCETVPGKRRLRENILNPTADIDYLNKEYDIVETILKNYEIVDIVKNKFKKIRDVGYVLRKIVQNRGCPIDFYKLSTSLNYLNDILKNNNVMDKIKYYLDDKCDNIIDRTKELEIFLDDIESKLKIDNCTMSVITTDEMDIFYTGFDEDFDKLSEKYNYEVNSYNSIIDKLNKFCLTSDKSKKTDVFVKENTKSKMASELQITTTKKKILEDLIKSFESSKPIIVINDDIKINLKNITFKKSTGSNYSIEEDNINKLAISINNSKHELLCYIKKLFDKIMKEVAIKYCENIYTFSSIIGIIDLIICKAYNAKKYNYSKPIIKNSDRSYFDVKDFFHPLIKHINQDEEYITNDLKLGKEKRGLLLFGTNAVGKTSSIRAIGMMIIMAQCGMYVPAAKLEYNPYQKIYSRILGNDNLFKGMSTYQVELSELRPIVHSSDKYSLVLGDELCSGTEHPSALSVNAAGILALENLGPTYIFATHYHDLVDWEEIYTLRFLKILHMSVIYDKKKDLLIYERKFKDGVGERCYGLEVLKSHHYRNDFVESCYELYNKYFKNLDYRESKYNSKLIKPPVCELCKKKIPNDTHHINEQNKADENGYIGVHHKNHKSNLVWLCKSCHSKQIEGNDLKIIKKVKTSSGYKLLLHNGDTI
jgi:DNA mismatch repair protein MutS